MTIHSKHVRIGWYIVALILLMITLTYASVPIYRLFCQLTGFGGTVHINEIVPTIHTEPIMRSILVKFNADTASGMPWIFTPLQHEVNIVVGESTLAFYKAPNPTDSAMIGVSTYNISPPHAAVYFNKIQCFCFEEQRLGPKESLDMPVFFYIDPAFANDPKMEQIHTITLSYTFFKAHT
jgi:cytochrome c oxidase assembly protein subunit 11